MTGIGMELFLRFAEGCRIYLEKNGLITREDNRAILSGNPSMEVLERVFFVAYPGLQKVMERLGTGDMFDTDVVREFYSYDHNKAKQGQGELFCLAYPARVVDKRDKYYMVSVEPLEGSFWLKSDLELRVDDWIVLHRGIIVEKISENFARKLARFLSELGISKKESFPKSALELPGKGDIRYARV